MTPPSLDPVHHRPREVHDRVLVRLHRLCGVDDERQRRVDDLGRRRLGGHTYMTSALGGGGGSQKSRQKEQNQLISVRDKWVSKNLKVSRTSYKYCPFGHDGPRQLEGLASARPHRLCSTVIKVPRCRGLVSGKRPEIEIVVQQLYRACKVHKCKVIPDVRSYFAWS